MTSPNKRRAPRGNRNALKHGFYARPFHPVDLSDPTKLNPSGLDAEIALMRVLMRRLVESSRGLTDFASLTELVRSFTLASLAFTLLLRTRCWIEGKSDDEFEALRQDSASLMAARQAARLAGQKAASAASLPARPDSTSN